VTEPEAESKLASWKVPQISLEVEYSPAVLSEIAGAARAALREAPKGELEIGGVLFGEHEAGSIRIQTWRPIDCQHTEGPSLRLLARDRVELACLLELARRTGGDLKDLQPVGWFVSHPRAGVRLSPSDLEIFNGFFPYPWQVTLAFQPVAEGCARAGFFVREAGGRLKSDSSYREFEIEPRDLPAPAETVPIFSWAGSSQPLDPPAERKASAISANQEPLGIRHVADIQMPDIAADSQEQGSFKRGRWLWAIAILLRLGIGGFLLKQRSSPRFESFPLRVFDARQTMQVEWDRNAALMQGARSAVLDIRDAGKSTRFALSPDEIRAGSMSYARQSGDVDLVMTVYPPTGPAVQGFGRLLAPPDAPGKKQGETPPSAAPSDATELRAERDALRAQVTRLEENVRREAAEKNRLQDLVRILETRLNVGSNPNSGSDTKQDK